MALAAFGSGIVPESPVPAWATWNSGGPISHGASGKVRVDIERHYVFPGGQQANDVEGDPDAPWPGKPYGFYENGAFTLGDAATSTTSMPPMKLTANVVSSIGPTITMAIGAGFGATFAPEHRATGALVGALVGGILGVIFAPG